MSNLEISANAFTIVCVWLAARNNLHTWWTGLVGCVLFAVLFYQSQLYADVALQIFFFGTGVLGWYQWMHSPSNRHLQRPVTSVSGGMLFGLTFTAIASAGIYGTVLKVTTDAYMPYIDSGVLMLSILAQFLLVNRKIDTWVFWLAVNTLSVPLFFSRGLYLTSVVYLIFWFNAWYGWYKWRKELDLL